MRWMAITVALAFSAATSAEPPRVKAARERSGAQVKALFTRAGLSYPPAEIFLRVVKDEDVLELWAAPKPGSPMILVHGFPVCARSGGPGPKRRRGDGQVPEGFYRIDRFNPWSQFHLSLGIDYPNASDRRRALAPDLGGDIFIHGGCATIGCVPLEDGPMEQLYLIAIDARAGGQRDLQVHLFPMRLTKPRLEEVLATLDPTTVALWRELAEGFEAFEETRRPPVIRVDPRTGAYRVSRRVQKAAAFQR